MIRVLIRLLAVLAAAPIVVLSAGASHACSCLMGDTTQYAEWADRVFTGEVTEVLSSEPKPDGERLSMAESHEFVVAVDEVYKGDATTEVKLVAATNSAACGYETLPGQGEEWVWFAHAAEGREDTWSVNICGGSGPAAGVAQELVDVLGEPTAPAATTSESGSESGSASGPAPGNDAESAADPGEPARMLWALGGTAFVAFGAAAGWRLRHRRD